MSTLSLMGSLFRKFGDFFRREQGRIAVFSALILVGVLSFEAGFLSGSSVASAPLIVEKPVGAASDQGEVAGVSDVAPTNDSKPIVIGTAEKKDCVFVGSKNSTLYHLPTCAPAKRIKPENRVCFVSAEDAVAKGYKPGCLK